VAPCLCHRERGLALRIELRSSHEVRREMAAEGSSSTGGRGAPTGCLPTLTPGLMVCGGRGGSSSSERADSPWSPSAGNQGAVGRSGRPAATGLDAWNEKVESRRVRESDRPRSDRGRL
jgi:hypothetical protein